MSSQNAIKIASTIQSKVGASLIASQSMLPRPEAAGVMAQAGGASLGVFLLRDLTNLQQRTYECVEKVANILQSQLDIAEDKERRDRDMAAELAKEKKGQKPAYGTGTGVGAGTDENFDDLEKAINKGTFSELLTGGVTAAMLAPQALKSFGKNIGGKLLRGGIYGAIAGFIAAPILDYITGPNSPFPGLDLDKEAKADIKTSLIGAGVGFGVAGIPGAIIGATTPMIAKVASYIGGTLNADEVKDSDFAGTAIGGAAAAMFTAGKLAGVLKGFSATTTLGVALGATPVILGVGAAAALGVGAMYLMKKVDEYQEKTLAKLKKTTEKLDRELGEWAAREEEGLFEKMGINLGSLSAMGEAQVAAAEANEQAGQNIEKFKADTSTVSKLTGLVSAITNYSDDALTTMLKDGSKADNFFSTMASLKSVAAKGGFGADSGAIFKSLAMMSDRVQNHAMKLLAAGEDDGRIKAAAKNETGSIRGQVEEGDTLENLPVLLEKKKVLEMEKADAERRLQEETKKLEEMRAAGGKRDGFFLTTNDFERQEKLVKKLTSQTQDSDNIGSVAQKLSTIERRIQRFGTTNGLDYTFDQLKTIMSDEEIKDLIKMSVQQRGAEFLSSQSQSNKLKDTDTKVNVAVTDNSDKKTIASNSTTIAKSDSTTGEKVFGEVSNMYAQ